MHYSVGSAAEHHCASQGSVLIPDLPPLILIHLKLESELQPSRAQSTSALKPNVKIQNIKAQAWEHATPSKSHKCLSKTTSRRCRFVKRGEHKAAQCRILLFRGGNPVTLWSIGTIQLVLHTFQQCCVAVGLDRPSNAKSSGSAARKLLHAWLEKEQL